MIIRSLSSNAHKRQHGLGTCSGAVSSTLHSNLQVHNAKFLFLKKKLIHHNIDQI